MQNEAECGLRLRMCSSHLCARIEAQGKRWTPINRISERSNGGKLRTKRLVLCIGVSPSIAVSFGSAPLSSRIWAEMRGERSSRPDVPPQLMCDLSRLPHESANQM